MDPAESRGYYRGLPSRPKLIARTDQLSRPWHVPAHEHDWHDKELDTISASHPIVGKWNDEGSHSLRQQVLDVLERNMIDWTAVDILQLRDRGECHVECHVVLFVSVSASSTSGELGRTIANEVKLVLCYHKLDDVECEVKESSRVPLSPTVPERNVIRLDCNFSMQYLRKEFSDCLNVSIASLDKPWRQGTRCLYLRDVQTREVFALTCRHVIVDSETAGEILPGKEPTLPLAMTAISAIQPAEDTFKEVLQVRQSLETAALRQVEKWESRTNTMDEDRRLERLGESQALLRDAQSLLPHLQHGQDLDNRRFGKLALVRDLGIRAHGELSDWCLIRLDPDCFERPISQLRNRVYVGGVALLPDLCDLPPRKDADGTVELEGVMSVDEMSTRSLTNVVKSGAGYGYSAGRVNPVVSVTRAATGNGPFFVALEWPMVAQAMGKPFSIRGDSGSCVWGGCGQIVGMITGGLERADMLASGIDFGVECAADVTYMTPMEWLMDDFEACGLEMEIV
ncbi:hypothetical protein GQ602_001513 [Ophiocordyceps camponoti-floridani]|uniref:Uncharacterized protein n=1 Tax=Ophiocordyceps camponoti-floridani TaxID=2030778 RepID=A0A8H4QE80_9HYPO|nr:hypothetical protein GQ602_001513 [Ophiocordyceps camponoti-floridani]